MKKSILLTSSLALLASSLLSGCDDKPLTLTAENTQVVIAPDAPPTVKFAAEEMTNFLSQVLGGPVKIVDAAAPVDAKSVRVPVDAEALRVNKEQNPSSSDAVSHRVYGEQNPSSSDAVSHRVSIVLGTNSYSVAAGLHPEKLPRDSFLQLSTSTPTPTIFIAGCDDPSWDPRAAWKRGDNGEAHTPFEHATLFGVYDFLERYAGCRFYFYGPLGTIVPKKTSLTVPCGTITESPDYIKRVWYSPGGALMEGDDLGLGYPRWAKHQVGFIQFMRSRRFSGTPLVHGVRHMCLRERFGKTHPEYFWASRDKKGNLTRHSDPKDGKYTHLCWTSGVVDEIYKDWVAYAKGEPPESRGIKCDRRGGKGVWPRLAYGAGVVSLAPDDGFIPCECDNCRAAYGTDSRSVSSSYASELIWGKTAELANRLKRDGIPFLIEQNVYTTFRKRPKNVTLPDNIIISLCQMGPWAEGNPVRRDADLAEVKAWSELCGGAKIFHRNWSLKYGALNIPDIPSWSPRAIGSYYARTAAYAKGVYNETSSDRWSHVFLNNYILGKMTWDTSFDANAAIDEHYDLMYGPAAPEMRKFFDELEDYWVNRVAAGKLTYDSMGPVYMIPTPFEMWRNIYTAEKLAEWQRLFAEAKTKVDGLPARRVELMRRNVLEPVVRARQAFAEETDAAREEQRRKREGVHNILDREYAVDFFRPAEKAEKTHEQESAQNYLFIPQVFESNVTYRLSFFLDAQDIVRTTGGYRFTGALVGLWMRRGWRHPSSTGATIGSTFGRVHQSIVFNGSDCWQPGENSGSTRSLGITVWLRGATGRMKVDGLILEKVDGRITLLRDRK